MNPTATNDHMGHRATVEPDFHLFGQVAEQVEAALAAGCQPDAEQLASQHPEQADEIRQLVPALVALHQLGHERPRSESKSGAAEQSASAPGTLGDYRIVREIGRGGMGVVYEAEQISLGRRVALKVLPFVAVMDQRQLARFKNEAQAAARLHHTNIVPVHSVGSERSVHYYAMQFIEGHTLAEVIGQFRQVSGLVPKVEKDANESALELAGQVASGQFAAQREVAGLAPTVDSAMRVEPGELEIDTPGSAAAETKPIAALSTEQSLKSTAFFRTVADLGIQAAEALDHAHTSGVLHRDVKPGNLILDTAGRLWVTDFGLARIESDPGLTMTGDIIGTLRYMSPEQALAKRIVVDHRTDIYSLGVTLYELLTLHPAFPGRDRQELLRQIAFEEPRPPRRFNRAIPVELETIITKAMAKNPLERYETAQDLADDLRCYLEDKPIRARRPGPVVRLRKWARRHKGLTGFAASLVFAAGVSVAVATVRHQQHLDRLVTSVREDLSIAKVALAQGEYSSVQRRLTGTQTRIAQDPRLLSQFQAPLEDLLHRAEMKLRLQRFHEMAEEARFDAVPAFWIYGVGVEDNEAELLRARRRLRAALEVFQVVEGEPWMRRVSDLAIEAGDRAAFNQTIAELLFLAARVESRIGWVTGNRANGARRAIALLDEVEKLTPNLRALYEFRSRYFWAVDDVSRSENDLRRAQAMTPSSWLDHFLLAQERVAQWNLSEGLREAEAALALNVDDYWCWLTWSRITANLNRSDQARWATEVLVNLQPEAALGWILKGELSGATDAAISDFSRGLALTRDAKLRARAYNGLGSARMHRGQLEDALRDFDEAVRLDGNAWRLLGRAECYARLGRNEQAGADARAALGALRKSVSVRTFEPRIRAYRVLAQPRLVVHNYLELLKMERNMERVDMLIERFRSELQTLDRSITERENGAAEMFLCSLGYWRLGDEETARRWYEKGVCWIEEHGTEKQDGSQYREQAVLAGIPENQKSEFAWLKRQIIDNAEEVLFGAVGSGNFGHSLPAKTLTVIDTQSGVVAPVGPPAAIETARGISGLAFRCDGRLFATSPVARTGPSILVELDPESGAVIRKIGAITAGDNRTLKISDLAVQPENDVLFGISGTAGHGRRVPESAKLYTIDVETAVATLVGDTGLEYGGGLAFGPDGTLFQASFFGPLWHQSEREPALLTLDPKTGRIIDRVMLKGPENVDSFRYVLAGLAVRPHDGKIFATGSINSFSDPYRQLPQAERMLHLFVTIDPSTGVVTHLSPSMQGIGSRMGDLAFRVNKKSEAVEREPLSDAQKME